MAKEDKSNNRFSIKILGEKLTITGDVSREYVGQLRVEINKIAKEITSAYPHLPRRRLWGLTLLNLADYYFKSRQELKEVKNEKKKIKKENEKLKQKIKELENENHELSMLLEEVD